MATLGQYAKAQTKSGAAAESGLQALMLLMQHMAQREDRRDEREWRQTNMENVRLQMEQLRLSMDKGRPGVQPFLNISDVRDGSTYTALDNALDDLGTITSDPDKAQTDAVKGGLKTPLGRTTAMVAESGGIPQQAWAKAWQETLELRAALEETISENVDPAEREQLLKEMDTKIRKNLGVDDARFGVLSQEALAAHLRQEAWKDGYSFEATTYEWMRAKHGDDPFISGLLELNKEKGPQWTFSDKVTIQQAQIDMLDGDVDELLRDMSKGEGGSKRTSAIDISVMEKLPYNLRQEGREIFFQGGQTPFLEFANKHAPREPGYWEKKFDMAQTIIEENPATAVVATGGTGYAAWLAKSGLWRAIKASGFGAAALSGAEAGLRVLQEQGMLEGEGAFIDNTGEFGGEGTLWDMIGTALDTPDPTGEVSGVAGEAPSLLDLFAGGMGETADALSEAGVFPHQWGPPLMEWLAEQAGGPIADRWGGAPTTPAPTLDDLVAGDDGWTEVNKINLGDRLGPPAPPPTPTGMPDPYQAPAGTPEMTPEMMLQLLSGQANAPMAGMGSPPVPQTLGSEANLWPVPANVPHNLSPQQLTEQHGLAPTLGGDVQLEKKFMELQELLEPGSQYAIPGRDTSMNPETGREMWPVPADVPRGEQFMGMPMADLAASDQAYETIAAEAQKEHEVNMFMQAMAQKNAIQESQQRREQISTLLRDASIEEDVLKANKMQLLYDLVGQEAPYYLQRP